MAKEIWVCDSETDPFRRGRVPKPFIWGLYHPDSGEYHEFEYTSDFIDFVYSKDIIVYAHNGGKFDWHFVTPFIAGFEPITIIAGRLAKFKIGACEFRDSYNIIPAPLKAYQKDDFDYRILEAKEREKPENKIKISKYLKNDCVYLGDLVQAFIAEYGLALTQAGAAMKYWLKMSGNKRPVTSQAYYSQMSPYYYGGRVECFEKGIIESDFDVIDIKSAYPRAMLEFHPWGGQSFEINEKEFHQLTPDKIPRSFIDVTTESNGAFPFRDESGALSFPNDGERRNFQITGWEYNAAIETKTLGDAEITKAICFLDKVAFVDYVNYFYDLKLRAEKSGNKIDYLFAKIFLNSLYGKFASNPDKYQEFIAMERDLVTAAHIQDQWDMNNWLSDEIALMSRPLMEIKKNFYDVAVSASITGFVRAYLWKAICDCEGVLYCDTDSIAAKRIGGGIPIGKELGQWELEMKCDYAAIGGKKMYAFREKETGNYKTASKGARLTAPEIIKVAKGEIVIYEPEAPTFSIKTGIKFTPRKMQST